MKKQINYSRKNTAKKVNYDHGEGVGIKRYDRCNMIPFPQTWHHLCQFKTNRDNRNCATDDNFFKKDINAHAVVKLKTVLITKLKMYVLAHSNS